jgi:hypothetical protein
MKKSQGNTHAAADSGLNFSIFDVLLRGSDVLTRENEGELQRSGLSVRWARRQSSIEMGRCHAADIERCRGRRWKVVVPLPLKPLETRANWGPLACTISRTEGCVANKKQRQLEKGYRSRCRVLDAQMGDGGEGVISLQGDAEWL